MSDHVPQVTVVMPMYNAETFVAESLSSIQRQTLTDIEILIVDDGSLDRSAEIVGRASAADSRIRLIGQRNQGVATARNTGINQARAEMVAFLDADDAALPERLARQYEFLIKNPDVAVLATNALRVGRKGQELGVFDAGPTTREEFDRVRRSPLPIYLVASSVMARRANLLAVGGFQPELKDGAEDVALWNRIADDSLVLTLPDRLVRYRVHRSGLSASRFAAQMRETARMVENIKRRRAGESEVSPADFETILAQAPWTERFSRSRDWKSKELYRNAGALLADRDPRGLPFLLAAFVVKPTTVVRRIRLQIVPWVVASLTRRRRKAA